MLPKIDRPVYSTKLPTTEQEIKFRPWTIKEEKILLLAKESDEIRDFINAMYQIVQNCIVDKIDVSALSLIDIEYMYLKIRVKSVGNNIPLKIDDPDDGEEYTLIIDIDNIVVLHDETHTRKIMLDDDLGVMMKYPSLPVAIMMAEKMEKDELTDGEAYNIVKSCIESVFDTNSVYPIAKCTDEEVAEFFDSLSPEHFQLLYTFFETMPKLSYLIKYKNRGGIEKEFLLENIKDFF